MIKRMFGMLLLAAAVFGPVFWFIHYRNVQMQMYFSAMPEPVVEVKVENVRAERWVHTIDSIGTLEAVEGVEISSEMEGLVRDIAFQAGQQVKKNDLLVRLDSEVEQSQLKSAQAELELARSNWARAERLVESQNISASALDSSRADLEVKRTQVDTLAAQIAKKSITAPFDGVLGIRRVQRGQYIEAGYTMVSLQNLSELYCNFSVSQKDLSRIEVGQTFVVKSDAYPDESFSGTVHAIEPAVDAGSGMVMVQGIIPNADGRLRPGMFVRASLALPDSEEVLSLPLMAVVKSLYGDAVYVVREQTDKQGPPRDVVQRVDVQELYRQQGRIAVKGELRAGERVVTSGTLKLASGTRVKASAEDVLTQAPTEMRY